MNRVLYLSSMRYMLLCAFAWYSGLSYDYRFIGNKRDLVLKKKKQFDERKPD